MTADGPVEKMGFVITKGPLESGLASGLLTIAESAMKDGKGIGICLMSDGAWLAKKGQTNSAHASLLRLMEGGAEVSVCREHLRAAGIAEGEWVEGLNVVTKTFKVLVGKVMEEWDRVVVV
jgi:sulfur relay (sulfurtransferase) complex TusBCD TusD component (DsrE family)